MFVAPFQIFNGAEYQDQHNMKPTQQQIDAALRYADYKDKKSDFVLLQKLANEKCGIPVAYEAALAILAAAYREKCEECEQLRDYIDGKTLNLP